MDIALKIILTFASVYGAYMLILAILSALGERELEKEGVSVDGDGDIEIPARAETLEYLVRCALLATTFERRNIVIIIDGDDADISQTAQKLCLCHKNIICRRK